MPAKKVAEYWVVFFGEDGSEEFDNPKLMRQWIKERLSEGAPYLIQKVVIYDIEKGVKS